MMTATGLNTSDVPPRRRRWLRDAAATICAMSPLASMLSSDLGGPLLAGVFRDERLNALVLVVVFTFLILWYIRRAQKGVGLYLRQLPGIFISIS